LSKVYLLYTFVGTSHMSDIMLLRNGLFNFISMVTNSALLRNSTGTNNTLLHNNTGKLQGEYNQFSAVIIYSQHQCHTCAIIKVLCQINVNNY
jgi:hypothetical protein